MTKEKFLKILNGTLEKISNLFNTKNQEYAEDKDVFANFKKAASGISFHKKPEQVAWEYATKHLQSIKDLIEKGNYSNKGLVDEKIDDVIVYLILIKAMIKEQQNINEILDKISIKESSIDQLYYDYSTKYKYTYNDKNK